MPTNSFAAATVDMLFSNCRRPRFDTSILYRRQLLACKRLVDVDRNGSAVFVVETVCNPV